LLPAIAERIGVCVRSAVKVPMQIDGRDSSTTVFVGIAMAVDGDDGSTRAPARRHT
jgi:hypothetical protein